MIKGAIFTEDHCVLFKYYSYICHMIDVEHWLNLVDKKSSKKDKLKELDAAIKYYFQEKMDMVISIDKTIEYLKNAKEYVSNNKYE